MQLCAILCLYVLADLCCLSDGFAPLLPQQQQQLAAPAADAAASRRKSRAPPAGRHGRTTARRALPFDPVDLAHSAADGTTSQAVVDQLHQHLLSRLGEQAVAGDAAGGGGGGGSGSLEAILSTMYAATSDVMLKPAHGHTQPLWGPPDPYLSAGKSIAPSAKSLIDMGIQEASNAITSGAAAAGQQQQGGGGGALAEEVRAAASNGWKVIDGSGIKAENVLPGFAETGGILPRHSAGVPDETPETLAAQVEWSAKFLNVVDRLPYVAFLYATVEFFFLRPNLDLYKEDIEDEPSKAAIETAVVTGVRLIAFAVISLFTLIIFGG